MRDVSSAANVSLGYLSEVERGRKEASSELLASICDALALDVSDLLDSVSRSLRSDVPAAAAKINNSTKPGIDPAARASAGGIRGSTIDPALRIVVPYSTRPGAPVSG